MTLVVDASVVVAGLVDTSAAGAWAEELLSRRPLFAPHLLPVECANTLRRAAAAGDVLDEIATLAHGDLGGFGFDLLPYEPFAERIWELRGNVSSYDAWYVAVAEALDVPMATLDHRLVRATGPRCSFTTPPG